MENRNLGHLMLDLETMGNKSNAAIVSIGAVEFDINTGEIGKKFYERVDLQSALDVGLKIDASTLLWWLQQNEKARNELCKSGLNISIALLRLEKFMKSLGNFFIWGRGVRFDIGLIENAYVAVGSHEMPWNFRNERDVRTLEALAPEIKKNCIFTGVEHNPIDDSVYQIKYCTAIWKKLYNIK